MKAFLSFLLWSVIACVSAQSVTALTGLKVLNIETGAYYDGPQTILLKEGKIQAIIPDATADLEPQVKRLARNGMFVVPAMVDGHVHFFQSGGLYARPDVIDLRKLEPYETEISRVRDQAADFFQRYLRCGVTRVMDVGGPMSNYDVRTQADSLGANAPKAYVTGPLITPYLPPEYKDLKDPPFVLCKTAAEARAAVQAQLPFKPDFIKIWYIVLQNETPQDHYDMVKATIYACSTHNIPVAVHATQFETARLAVTAGAKILVHSIDDEIVDEELVKMLVKNQVTYIPTLMVSSKYFEVLSQHLDISEEDFEFANPFALGSLMDLRHIPAKARPRFVNFLMSQANPTPRRSDSISAVNLKILSDAGVNVVTGTDAGNIGTQHASSYFQEIRLMQQAGLSPATILKAGSINAAKALGASAEWGKVAPGYEASFLVLKKDPLEDISNLNSLHELVWRGEVQPAEKLAVPTPEMVAQQQLNAYNARDIDAFVACYSDTVKVYNFPNELSYTGTEQMREQYGRFFQEVPNLHCELVNRITVGNKVIDREKVTGFTNGYEIEAVAIYTVEQGKITEVYFIRG
ncbi:MAG: amidohydrolase family protein [Bacteroidota bacterium]